MKPVRDQDLGEKPRKKKSKAIIKESAEDQLPQNSGSMEDQKTYEDYNKEQPLAEVQKPKESKQKLADKTKEKK